MWGGCHAEECEEQEEMVLALRDALSLGAVSLTRQGLVSTPRSVFRFSFFPLLFPPFFLSGVLWCYVVHAA